jgi:hypothetical protein
MKYLFIILIVIFIMSLTGCGSGERAQAVSDARAGLNALRAAFVAGEATADILAILNGVDKYLPAASGVNSSEWPAPRLTPEQIQANPIAYGEAAPPEPEKWTLVAALSGAAVLLLGVLRVAAPVIPGAGPIVQGAANLAWSLMATHKQKQADQIAQTITQAAQTAKPFLDELRALPLDQLPPSLRELAQSPSVSGAVQRLAETPSRTHA